MKLSTVPESVKEAWQEAMEESGVNPFSDGFSTLSQLVMEQDLMTGGDDNIFGNTVESSLAATKKILDRIENPLGKVDENKAESLQREKKFYSTLLRKLENIKLPKQDYENTMKTKRPAGENKESKILGMGFLHNENNTVHYGMCAMYAEDYSEENPVIKVNVTRQGGTEEYRININEVNPRNATEIEMFALCCYADDKGIGTGGTFGSWQTLNYYRDNASHNGYFERTNATDSFQSAKQDWMKMIQLMMKDYMNAGLFRQSMDGKGLLGIFERMEGCRKLQNT